MLSIEFTEFDGKISHSSWWISMQPFNHHQARRATYVQADGDELEYIRQRFENLPISHSLVVCWHGDLAKFIIANL